MLCKGLTDRTLVFKCKQPIPKRTCKRKQWDEGRVLKALAKSRRLAQNTCQDAQPTSLPPQWLLRIAGILQRANLTLGACVRCILVETWWMPPPKAHLPQHRHSIHCLHTRASHSEMDHEAEEPKTLMWACESGPQTRKNEPLCMHIRTRACMSVRQLTHAANTQALQNCTVALFSLSVCQS